MSCPFCDSPQVERVGQWGGQIITAQWRCRGCGSYFEAVRDDFSDRPPGGEGEPHGCDRLVERGPRAPRPGGV